MFRLSTVLATFAALALAAPLAHAEPPVFTKVLQATEAKVFSFHEAWDSSAWYCSPHTDGLAPNFPSDPRVVWAGHSFWYDPGTNPFPCASKRDYIYRGAVRFFMNDIPSRNVKAAYLEFDRLDNGAGNSALSCATRVTEGNATWGGTPQITNWFDTGFPINPLPPHGFFQNGITTVDAQTHHFTVEVSSVVKKWVQFGGNTGFMITDNDERTLPNGTSHCLSSYGNFQLLVGYYQ